MQSRMLWVGTVLFFAFLGIMVALVKSVGPVRTKAEPDPISPLLAKRRLQAAWICGLSFLIAELSAIAFTYAEPGVGLFGAYGVLASSLGANLFPVVAKYATALQPPLSPTALFRVQSIVSIFMLAAIPCIIASVRSALVMSDTDWRRHFESTSQRRPSDIVVMLAVPFAIFAMTTGFFGWFEFGAPAEFERMTAKKCIMQAICYTRGDDLLIFVAGGMKTFVVFGFPLGAIVLVIANGVLAQANSKTQKNKD